MTHDPRAVLEALAASLDAAEVLDRFPGLTREGLKRIVAAAAGKLPRRESDPARSPQPFQPLKTWPKELVAYIDGGARGNPGAAGATSLPI